MAVALGNGDIGKQTTDGSSGTSLSFNTTSSVPSNGRTIVTTHQYGSTTPTCTIGGASATLDATFQKPADTNYRVHVFSLDGAQSSGATVAVSWSSGVFGRQAVASYITGAATSSAVDVVSSNNSNSGSPYTSASISTTNADDLLWGFVAIDFNAATTSPTNSFSSAFNLYSAASNTGIYGQYRVVSATGSYAATGTWVGDPGGNVWYAGVLAYKAAATGTDQTVTAVVADGTGAAPAPAVTAGATVTNPPADGTGAAPTAAVTAAATVTSPTADGAGDTPSPAVAGSVPLLDDFERADESPLGSPWLETGYTDAPPFTLANGAIYGAGGAIAQRYDAEYNPDVKVRAVMRTGEELDTADGRGGANINVAVRGSGTLYPDNTKCYFGDVVYDGVSITGYIGIYDYTLGGGGFAIIDDTLLITSPAWVGGVEFEAAGSTLTLRVMTSPGVWEDFVTATDTQLSGAGGIGLGRTGGTGDSDDWYGIEAVYLAGQEIAAGDQTITAPAADATGDTPAPAATAGSAITSPPADGTGAAPIPAVTAGSTVTTPPADGTGQFPPLNQQISSEVTTGPADATGAAPAPSVTGGSGASDQTVTAVPADGTGTSPPPTVTAGSTVTSPAADATGAIPAPAATAGSTVTTVPADGTGAAPAPAVGGSSTVTTPPAAATGQTPAPNVTAGATVTAPPAASTGQSPAPTVTASGSATVTNPAADATGTIPAPTVTGNQAAAVTAPPATGTGTALPPAITAGASLTTLPADSTGAAPAPAVTAGATVTSPPSDGTGTSPQPIIAGTVITVETPPADGTGNLIPPTVRSITVLAPAPVGTARKPRTGTARRTGVNV